MRSNTQRIDQKNWRDFASSDLELSSAEISAVRNRLSAVDMITARRLNGANGYRSNLAFDSGFDIVATLVRAAQQAGQASWFDMCCGDFQDVSRDVEHEVEKTELQKLKLVGIELDHYQDQTVLSPHSTIWKDEATRADFREFFGKINLITCIHGLQHIYMHTRGITALFAQALENLDDREEAAFVSRRQGLQSCLRALNHWWSALVEGGSLAFTYPSILDSASTLEQLHGRLDHIEIGSLNGQVNRDKICSVKLEKLDNRPLGLILPA